MANATFVGHILCAFLALYVPTHDTSRQNILHHLAMIDVQPLAAGEF